MNSNSQRETELRLEEAFATAAKQLVAGYSHSRAQLIGLLDLALDEAPSVPSVPSEPWQQDSAKFRKRWLELFPDTTEEELLILDNCAGLRLLKEDDGEVTFWTDGHAIGFDKQTSIEVIAAMDSAYASNMEHESGSDGCGEGCPACEDEKQHRIIQLWKDHGNGAGGGREVVDEFSVAELVNWFRAQIDQ